LDVEIARHYQQRQAEHIEGRVEGVDERGAENDEDRARDERERDAEQQHLLLRDARHRETADDHQEYEQVVNRESFVAQIAREVFDRHASAAENGYAGTENEGNPDIYR
jgi:hypothetical protein